MNTDENSVSDPLENAADDDWETRRLCGDGNCIGVIGPDGLCKECGRPYDPNGADDGDGDAAEAAGDPVEAAGGDEGKPADSWEADSPDSEEATDDDWNRRVLCSDGNCIGVIGPDGRCKECGMPYGGGADADSPTD